MMNTSERLHAMRDALQQRGVLDVKFYFERGSLSSLPNSVVATKVADFLDCYLSGQGQAQKAIGDEA